MSDVKVRPAATVDAGAAGAIQPVTVASDPADPYLREVQIFPHLTEDQVTRASAFGQVIDLPSPDRGVGLTWGGERRVGPGTGQRRSGADGSAAS